MDSCARERLGALLSREELPSIESVRTYIADGSGDCMHILDVWRTLRFTGRDGFRCSRPGRRLVALLPIHDRFRRLRTGLLATVKLFLLR